MEDNGLQMLDGRSLSLVTAPAVPLLTTAEAKAHARIDHAEDDAYVDALVAAATEYLDGPFGVLGRALVTQTWSMTRQYWPGSAALHLPVPPVQSVTSVVYFDQDNVEQTFAAENYRLVATDTDAVIELVVGASWPAVYARSDAITVTFVAGYGDAAADVPEPLRLVVRLLVAGWYEAREAASDRGMEMLPFGVRTLIANYRLPRGLI